METDIVSETMPSKKIKTMEMAKIIVIIFPLLLGLLGS
jgi:hypothetical protein